MQITTDSGTFLRLEAAEVVAVVEKIIDYTLEHQFVGCNNFEFRNNLSGVTVY